MIPLGQITSAAIVPLLRRQPLSPAKVSFVWRTVVGASMARASQVSLSDDGRLVVVVADAHWRKEIRRTTPMIRPRLQALLGADIVRRLDVRAPERSSAPKPSRGSTS